MLGFQKYWGNGLWESTGPGTDYGKLRDQVQFTGSYVTGNGVWEATRMVYGKLWERFTRSYRNGLWEATGTVYGKLRQRFMGTVYRNGLRKRFTGSYGTVYGKLREWCPGTVFGNGLRKAPGPVSGNGLREATSTRRGLH